MTPDNFKEKAAEYIRNSRIRKADHKPIYLDLHGVPIDENYKGYHRPVMWLGTTKALVERINKQA